ncbi:MAG: hypothetical protein U0Z17_06830 [Bacteroidales bacterium]
MTFNDLQKINPEDIHQNPFTLIDKDWFLLSAGNLESFNTMTASWGGVEFYGTNRLYFAS